MLENLRKYNILLASKSPRRRELLAMLRIPFSVVTFRGIKEVYPADLPATEVPVFLSRLKADAHRVSINDNELIITADTVVVIDGKILGKPANRDQAIEMLQLLSGKTHHVITGFTVTNGPLTVSDSASTAVTFAEISNEQIEWYVDNYRPFDKAGAYGIQEWIGAIAISKIEGSYYNVMGLPLHRLYHTLLKF